MGGGPPCRNSSRNSYHDPPTDKTRTSIGTNFSTTIPDDNANSYHSHQLVRVVRAAGPPAGTRAGTRTTTRRQTKLAPTVVRVFPQRFPRIMRTRTTRTNSYELCGRRAPLPELVPLPGPSPKLVPPLVRVFPNKSCIKEKLVPFVPTRTNCVGGGPARRGLGEYANYRRCNQRKHDCTLQPQRHMFGSPPDSLEYRMKCMWMNIFLATLAVAAVYIAATGYIVQRAKFPDAAQWTCRIN